MQASQNILFVGKNVVLVEKKIQQKKERTHFFVIPQIQNEFQVSICKLLKSIHQREENYNYLT